MPQELARFTEGPGRFAYVSLAATSVDAAAALVLMRSLDLVGTKADRVLLLDHVTIGSAVDSIATQFTQEGVKVVLVEPVPLPELVQKYGPPRHISDYTKIKLWQLTQYDKVVFLHCQSLVLQPIDELFAFPEFTAPQLIGASAIHNTGFGTHVFVAAPNNQTYSELLQALQNKHSRENELEWSYDVIFDPQDQTQSPNNQTSMVDEHGRVMSAATVVESSQPHQNHRRWNIRAGDSALFSLHFVHTHSKGWVLGKEFGVFLKNARCSLLGLLWKETTIRTLYFSEAWLRWEDVTRMVERGGKGWGIGQYEDDPCISAFVTRWASLYHTTTGTVVG
eukprot:c11626_g2_i1.p1 GENE.c11626_g2_i1~~c11626_g2_i1.p1  ORF type:complete len:387 (-),score=99.70 c11626_g2_i1:97-1104(-)